MKILSLNVWGGKERDALLAFIERIAPEVDVFCFQEMLFGEEGVWTETGARRNIYLEIKPILEDFVDYSYFAPLGSHFEGEALDCVVGQSIFVKKSYAVTDIGGFRTYPKTSPIVGNSSLTMTGNCQWLVVGEKEPVLILNLHGLWQKGKLETPERFEQSQILKSFLDSRIEQKVLIGDFNMRPEIESMDILRAGMRDMIAEKGITSTRSSLYDKPEAILYSDYALVSKDSEVVDFTVLQDVVSDHLPLLLELR